MPKGGRALEGVFREMLDDLLRVTAKDSGRSAEHQAARDAARGAEHGAARDAARGAEHDAARAADHAPRGDGWEPMSGRPNEPVTAADHPYLRPDSRAPEPQALPGRAPQSEAQALPTNGPHGSGIPDEDLANFRGPVTPETWPAGETRYRVVGDGQRPAGPYWTQHPPASDDVLRSDLAVRNDWNGNHGVVAYTPTEDVPVWRGEVGPQNSVNYPVDAPHHLPGGGEQIFVNWRDFPAVDLTPGNPAWAIRPTNW